MMLKIIFLLIVGGIMVYLAQHNLTPVTLQIGSYVYAGIPLFYIIIGSMLTGLGIAYLIFLINAIVTAFSLRGKDRKIKESKNEIAELTKQIHKLELENEELKNEAGDTEPTDKNAL